MEAQGGRISGRGQVTIPVAVREALGVAKGDDIYFHVDGARVLLTASADPIPDEPLAVEQPPPAPAPTLTAVPPLPARSEADEEAIAIERRARRRATLRLGYRTT